ncbi:DMT family transporter [Actinokineospora guangxiensis]|uniref:DMT family transporter n=1 Tax=Actinokineospora guangxiensis TaxID=1490288 RepID=A0ABW0EM06_9PSEU
MNAVTHDRRVGPLGPGLGLAVVSASSFGLSGSLGRGLMDAGWTSAAAVAVRVLVAAAVLLPVAALRLRGRWHLVRRNLPVLLAYGLIAVAACQLAFFNAVARMDVGVALLVEYTAPVAVAGWLWLRRGQRPTRLTILGAVLSIGGLLLVLDVLSGAEVDPAGVLWALGAMVGAAFYFVLSARERDALPGVALAAGGLLIGGSVLLAAGLVGFVPLRVTDAPVVFNGVSVPWWLPVLLLGVVTAALGYVAGIAATRRLGARLASFVALTEVLMSLVFAWLLLDQAPRSLQLCGVALTVLGVVVVKLGEPRTA